MRPIILIGLAACLFFVSFVAPVSATSFPKNVNMKVVRSTWLGWYNATRIASKLPKYTLNSTLSRTAATWSSLALRRGYIDHKRDGQTAYYDYKRIKKWFAEQGVVFRGADTLFSENIGWSAYHCTQEDCTQALISAIRPIFDSYVSEKGKENSSHYDSITSSFFSKIGLGVAVDEDKGKLYLTVHYARKIP